MTVYVLLDIQNYSPCGHFSLILILDILAGLICLRGEEHLTTSLQKDHGDIKLWCDGEEERRSKGRRLYSERRRRPDNLFATPSGNVTEVASVLICPKAEVARGDSILSKAGNFSRSEEGLGAGLNEQEETFPPRHEKEQRVQEGDKGEQTEQITFVMNAEPE